MKNLFIIILRYIKPIEDIDSARPEHLLFLDKYYDNGVFLASGMQNPRTGGVIIAKCEKRADLEKIILEDPFSKLALAEFQIFEFYPNKYSKEFREILGIE